MISTSPSTPSSSTDPAAQPADRQAPKPAVKRAAKATAKVAAVPAVQTPANPVAKAPVKKAAPSKKKTVSPKATHGKAKVPARPMVPAAPATKPAKQREKLVRDSFTMPRSDFALVQQLKDRAIGFRHAAKKSELLRAGLHALMAMDNVQLQATLATLPMLKTGRPRKAG